MGDRQRERMGTFFLQHLTVFLRIEQTCKDSGTFLTLIHFPCSSKGHNLPVQWAMMQSAPHKAYSNSPLKHTKSVLFIKQIKCAATISNIDETDKIHTGVGRCLLLGLNLPKFQKKLCLNGDFKHFINHKGWITS